MTARSIVVSLWVLLCAQAQAVILLGVHAEEPAPSIGNLVLTLTPDGERIELKSFASSDEVVAALQRGDVDLGIIEDSEREHSKLALVTDLYPSVLHLLVREDQVPDGLGEFLQNGPIWAGAPGSTGFRLAQWLAQDFRIPESDLTLLDNPYTEDPSSYFIFGGILQTDALDRLSGFRLASLDSASRLMNGSVAEGIALRYPYLRPFVLPAQLYPSLSNEPALTLSISNLLVTRTDLPANTIFELARELDALRPRIAAVYPLAGSQQLADRTRAAQAVPLHIGARRYRDRDEPGFLERYAEVLALAMTLTIATGTVLASIRRQRRQSRKDRLDTFYQRLLDLRFALTEKDVAGAEIAIQVRAAQAEVMALVIDERIDADGSLIAFLTLSNRLLDESAS
ncbi:MAG: TAXI family TRAP transporter solute-binding subunit [Pseudomonadota bacterium]